MIVAKEGVSYGAAVQAKMALAPVGAHGHSRLTPERRCRCGRSFQVGDSGSRCGRCRGGMGWLAVLEFVGPAGKGQA